ncbi:MAG: FAD-dependent thymidylate synthase [Patescibacteria group bacterium]
MELFPAIDSPVLQTEKGTRYLQCPGVVMIAMPQVYIGGMKTFLDGFDPALQFPEYLNDDPLTPAEQLSKTAGQLCYMSFGPKRTKNADAQKYFDNIKSSGHGSVLEHSNFSFLFYGISRSVTHELVRHRAGFGFSQVSQRYVSGSVVRFVERPEYASNKELHELFMRRIDEAAAQYAAVTEKLLALQQSGQTILSADAKTDLRKKIQQASRSLLPNETEAPIVTTANVRAWRHFIEMRANPHAETEIRALAFRVFECLQKSAPQLFHDYEVAHLSDGTQAVSVTWKKV